MIFFIAYTYFLGLTSNALHFNGTKTRNSQKCDMGFVEVQLDI